jgi:hypothetical protein
MVVTINRSLAGDFGGNIGYENLTEDIVAGVSVDFFGMSLAGDVISFYFDDNFNATSLQEFDNVVTNYVFVVDVPRNEGVFGTEYQYVEDELTSTTTSTIFIEKLKLTTRNILEGKYKISWYYQWIYSAATQDFKGRVQLDDSINIMSHQQEPKDGGDEQKIPVSGFKVLDLTAGVHTIDIDFCRSDSPGTATISNARLEIFRVA